jgi:hypothetical protein
MLAIRGKGSFDCVGLRFANADFAQDDRVNWYKGAWRARKRELDA